MSEYISRDELSVLSNLRWMCFFAFLACCTLIKAGKKSLKASKSQKLWFVGSNLCMNTIRFTMVFFFILCILWMGENTRQIVKDHHAKQGKGLIQEHHNKGGLAL